MGKCAVKGCENDATKELPASVPTPGGRVELTVPMCDSHFDQWGPEIRVAG
jgi:hypothetical protein